MTEWYIFKIGVIQIILHEWFRIFYVYFTKYALYMFLKLCMFYALWPFLMFPKGERKMGILRNLDIIFSRLKIKHKFKKKGGERDE